MLEELSEEDQQLKSDLDMLAERILVRNPHLHPPSLYCFAHIDTVA